MARFVLIHGAWHDSRVWERVAPRLVASGHTVETPDLPGNGQDDTPPGTVGLATYVDFVDGLIGEGPPAILVGHSMAGIILSELGERAPEKVSALVYLAAFMLPPGGSIIGFYQEHGDPNMKGARAALRMSPDGAYSTIDPSLAPDIFFNTCAPEDAAAAAMHLGPMPARPRQEPVNVGPERWGRLPRYYGRTLRDKTVFPPLQDKMLALLPGASVRDFDTDHSPFLCDVDNLVSWLDEIGRRHG